MHVLSKILNVTFPLGQFLQGKVIGLDNAAFYVTSVIDILKETRTNSENEFASIIQCASNNLEASAVELKYTFCIKTYFKNYLPPQKNPRSASVTIQT